MGMLARLIGLEDDQIPIHTFFGMFAQYRRSDETAVKLTTVLDAYSLTDKTETISTVATGTNKLGLSVSHTWADDDFVYLTTTGGLPAPLAGETGYWVISSNPTQGTVKLSTTKGGTEIDITTEGTGTHTLKRAEADFGYWEFQRISVTHTGGNEAQKERRFFFDQLAEQLAITAKDGHALTTVANFKSGVERLVTHLTVS